MKAMWLSLGLILFAVGAHAAEPKGTGKVIVGMKAPATPAVVKQLAKVLPGRIVRVGAGGVYLLLQPAKGATEATIKAASPLIAYAEREVAMGATFPAESQASGQ